MSPAREAAYCEERRSSRRYPVGLDLHYKLSRNRTIVKEGSGKTRDFSTDGVFFQPLQTELIVPAGLDVELSVDWPAPGNQKALVMVAIFGHTVRSGPDGIAARISRCEVRANSSARKSAG